MFCTECGQQMADDAKFCAFCGTRRSIPAAGGPAGTPPPVVEPPVAVPPPASTVRSTAEITPIRVQHPAPTPPAYEAPPQQYADTVVPWPEKQQPEQPLFTPPVEAEREEVLRQPAYATPPPPAAAAAPTYRSVPFAAAPGDRVETRRSISPVLVGAIIVAVIALGGIFWMVRSTMSTGSKANTPVTITIFPTTAKVTAGKSVDFVAEVGGATAGDVDWTVEEGGSGGEIRSRGASAKDDKVSLYCTYTAPKTPGTYHLVATSTVDKNKSATAEITVSAK